MKAHKATSKSEFFEKSKQKRSEGLSTTGSTSSLEHWICVIESTAVLGEIGISCSFDLIEMFCTNISGVFVPLEQYCQ